MTEQRGNIEAREREVPLGHLLSHVERQMTRRLETALAADGLTVDQWRVLDLLSDSSIGPDGPMLLELLTRLGESLARPDQR